METRLQEEKLTLKDLQKHVIKAIIGALSVSIVTAIGAFIITWFKTNQSVNVISKTLNNHTETISTLQKDFNEVKQTLSNTNIYTTANKEKAQSLENQMNDMKKQQDEIIKILYEIKAKVK